MTQNELDQVLQLLCSEDSANQLLALQILQGFKEMPIALQFVVCQLCYSGEKSVVDEANTLLQERITIKGFQILDSELLVFTYADQNKHATLHKSYHYRKLPQKKALHLYSKQHSFYTPLIPKHAYYLDCYLQAGIFWTYESQIFSSKKRLFFESVLQFYPTHPYALFGLGDYYRSNQSYLDKSITYYQKFLAHHPNLFPSDEMHSFYKSVAFSEIDLPTTFNAFQHLAYLYHYQLENPAKAIDYYQKARKQSPDNPSFAYYFLAKLLWKNKGNFREALKTAIEGLSVLNQNKYPTDRTFNGFMLQPLNAKADLHDLMGDIYAEELQGKKQAFDHFQQALKLAPNRISIHLKRIHIAFEDFKNDSQTEELCLQALKYAPKNVEIKGYLKKAQKV